MINSSLFFILALLICVFILIAAYSAKLKSDEQYRELVQFSNSIILRMDDKGRITFLNRFAQDFFGFAESEIIGKSTIGTIVPKTETTGKDLEDMIRDIIDSSEKYKININENMRKNGERVWIIWTNKAFQVSNRKREILCIGNDMTKIKEAEEKLKEAMEIKNRFVSIASHELRSPLAAIRGSIDLIADGLTGPVTEKQKYWLDVTRSYIARLNRVTDDILTVQKFEAGKMSFEMRKNDLNATVSEITAIMKNSVSEKGLGLLTDLDGKIPEFIFDKDRIVQVLVNLINNAVKFTDKGCIRVSTALDKDRVKVSVTDTGCGMPAKELPKVFEKFEQLSNAQERKSGGTGLGLSIAKEIVVHHGGDIRVESELGRGTSFYFTLPLTPPGTP